MKRECTARVRVARDPSRVQPSQPGQHFSLTLTLFFRHRCNQTVRSPLHDMRGAFAPFLKQADKQVVRAIIDFAGVTADDVSSPKGRIKVASADSTLSIPRIDFRVADRSTIFS